MKIADAIQTARLYGMGFIKTAALLSIGIFLICAPAPDSELLSEISSNLIVASNNPVTEEQFATISNI